MSSYSSERGFALTEVLIASVITLVMMGVAFSTFRDGLSLNDTAMKVTDASQNLRAGTNLLIRDLLQVGRNMPIGGIPVPDGGPAVPIRRPSRPGTSLVFDPNEATVRALTTGQSLGPTVSGRPTDLITLLMQDVLLNSPGPDGIFGNADDEPSLTVRPASSTWLGPKMALDGSSFSLGNRPTWPAGDPVNGIAPVRVGDILYFISSTGTAPQTATRMDATNIYFETNDPFMLNQRNATAGSITQMLGTIMEVKRVVMITYYVYEQTAGEPRLMRQINFGTPQALAGVVEDLQFKYDLVDGANNVANIDGVPYTDGAGNIYSASQIRKVRVAVGVRSETRSQATKDFMRHYVTTVTSLRNLAYVDRYQ